MTNIPDCSRTALLVIDVQEGVVADAHNRDYVIANINILLEKARTKGVPVVWVQHSDEGLTEGSAEWEYVADLQRRDGEPLVHKHYGDSFEETDLESILAEREVGWLVVTGAQTRASARHCMVRWCEAMTPAGRRRPHHRRHAEVGCPDRAGRSDRLHQPLLAALRSSRTLRQHHPDCQGRLRADTLNNSLAGDRERPR